MRHVSLINSIFFLFSSVAALAGTPTVTTFQTRITTPSGSALEAPSVNFRFTILDSAGTCALYVEDYVNVNMSGSSGIVSFSLGAGAKQYPAGVVSMYEVFNNAAPSFPCQAGGTYVPGPTDRRQIVMQFNDGAGWQTLPQLAINSVFYSNYALRSENLGSYPANDYLRPATLPTCTASQSLRWDGTNFTCITASGGGGAMAGVTSIANASGDITLAPATGTGAVLVNSSTPSTSTTTGAVVITGGMGVSGAINSAGNITTSGTFTTGVSGYIPQLYGTSTPSGNIRIDGTSDASKGNILLAATGGNVGIGTTTPTAILDVYGGTPPSPGHGRGINLIAESAYQSGPTDYGGGRINIKGGRGYIYGGGGEVALAGGDSSSAGTGATLVLGGAPYQAAGTATLTGGSGWNGMGNVTIQGGASTPVGYVLLQPGGGNVAVGTTTANFKLDVAGDVNVTGNFRVNGVVLSSGGGANQTGVSSISNASGDITLAPAVGTGAVQINSGAASTSPTTGALVVSGGIGASGGIYSGGAISSGASIYALTSMFSPQLYGTSTASGNILIDGTSNAVKGNVLLASAGGKVGVGTTTPTATFQVIGTNGVVVAPNAPNLFTVSGGNGYATGNGNGGAISLTAGTSSGTGNAGTVSITGGTGTNGAGGAVTIAAGSGNTGSELVLRSGDNWARNGANAEIVLGAAGTVTTGSVSIRSGLSNGAAGSNSGSINIFTPNVNAGFSATAGNVNITAGNGQFAGTGGAVNITAGNGGATNVNGSNVVINAGAKGGTGTDGNIILAETRGNVGIGVASPVYKLEVNGNMKLQGRLEASDYIVAGGTNDGFITSGFVAANYSPSNGSGSRISFETYNNGYGGLVDPGNITGVLVDGANGSERGDLYFGTLYNGATTEKMRLTSSGNLGIGTSTPSEKVHVVGNVAATGQIASGSQTITGGTTAIDWNNGNAIMTDYDCAAPFQFANMRDGGSYTLVVTGAGTTQCDFSTITTGTGAATVNYRFKPANAARNGASYSVYTLLRVGTTVLVSWTSGF